VFQMRHETCHVLRCAQFRAC